MRALLIATITALALAAPGHAAAPTPADSPDPAAAISALPDGSKLGTWKNPQGSVHIRTSRCGDKVCGTVVWANAKAKADAKKGGTDRLIGLQLFEEFAATGPREWKGKVFVPDINKRVSGKATLIGRTSLKVAGCVAGGLICKDQMWSRIG